MGFDYIAKVPPLTSDLASSLSLDVDFFFLVGSSPFSLVIRQLVLISVFL